jgi:hypothetical protein
MCIPGRDEVYFRDSCGNPANIYDASKTYDKQPSYWQKRVDKSESCGFNAPNGNAGSKSCGNCEYFLGSICSEGEATYGDYVCKDINCYNTQNGNDYENGESWCVYQSEVGNGVDPVGSRHFRHVCSNGEEIVEPCADFRREICIQNDIATELGDFTEAACRVNRWVDCIDQDEEEACLNTDKRDCFWKEGVSFITDVSGETTAPATTTPFGETQTSAASHSVQGVKTGGHACLSTVPVGGTFWQASDLNGLCSIANTECTVTFEKRIIGGKKCKSNCECLTEDWVAKMNSVCTALGDCGAYVNLAGKYTDDGVKWYRNGQKQKISQGLMNYIGKK